MDDVVTAVRFPQPLLQGAQMVRAERLSSGDDDEHRGDRRNERPERTGPLTTTAFPYAQTRLPGTLTTCQTNRRPVRSTDRAVRAYCATP